MEALKVCYIQHVLPCILDQFLVYAFSASLLVTGKSNNLNPLVIPSQKNLSQPVWSDLPLQVQL